MDMMKNAVAEPAKHISTIDKNYAILQVTLS